MMNGNENERLTQDPMHTCVELVSLRGAASAVTVVTDVEVINVPTVSAPTLSNFRLDDGESVVESLSLLFTTETVDGAVVVTLLVVSLATAVAINDADAVSLMTIF